MNSHCIFIGGPRIQQDYYDYSLVVLNRLVGILTHEEHNALARALTRGAWPTETQRSPAEEPAK